MEGVEKLSSLNVQPNSKCLSPDARFDARFGRLGFPGVGGWGRKPSTSLSERLLEREGPRTSIGWVIIIRVAPGIVGSGGVESGVSDSSDSV